MATITTRVMVLSVNEVDDDELEALADNADFDSVDEYVDSMAESVEALIATKLFGDADEIPILDVNTEVEE